MEAVRKEAEIRGRGNHSLLVRDFLVNAEDKLRRLKTAAKMAQGAFRECVEFFAESPRTTDANTFFSLLVRFVKAFKFVIAVVLLSAHREKTPDAKTKITQVEQRERRKCRGRRCNFERRDYS
ncbi:formin-like protein [Diorhabda sublineata]|uniref:formin-like protein n=1 Tax=Diorhabda sublineata TaxID=1163346 RepID=UPI0024E04D15|nr:formin-like protein [Diorhabda sublineata]